MTKTENFEQVEITSAEALWDWLQGNHNQEESVWLVTHMKAAGDTYVSREEVLDALLAYGWIDGIRRKLDETKTMQLIAPRKTQHWAKSYKERVAKLTQEGRMQPAGVASVEASKANGLWSFMDDVDALIVPEDLSAALSNDFFHAAAPSYRRNVLRWIKLAKTPATRTKRIGAVAVASAKGEKLPQM